MFGVNKKTEPNKNYDAFQELTQNVSTGHLAHGMHDTEINKRLTINNALA